MNAKLRFFPAVVFLGILGWAISSGSAVGRIYGLMRQSAFAQGAPEWVFGTFVSVGFAISLGFAWRSRPRAVDLALLAILSLAGAQFASALFCCLFEMVYFGHATQFFGAQVRTTLLSSVALAFVFWLQWQTQAIARTTLVALMLGLCAASFVAAYNILMIEAHLPH